MITSPKDSSIMITYQDLLSKCSDTHEYGTYFSTRCVFHNDSGPSLLVFKDGWFKCLGCNKAGHWKTLWNKLQGQPVQVHAETRVMFTAPNGSSEYLNDEELCYQAHMDLIKFPSLQWGMEMRGLGDSVEIAEIGYHRGWYTIPVRDRDYNFQTVVFRAAPHVQEATGHRYWCHGKPMMYVPDWKLLDNMPFVVVVFGMLDALTLNKFRYPVVTATSGKNQFCAEWLDEFRKPVYIIPDKGEEDTAHKLASNLGWRGKVIRLDYPDGIKDCNDYLIQGKDKLLQAQLTRVQ
jgi:hypothetical protein